MEHFFHHIITYCPFQFIHKRGALVLYMADHGVSGTAFGEDEMLTASQINKTRKAWPFRQNELGGTGTIRSHPVFLRRFYYVVA